MTVKSYLLTLPERLVRSTLGLGAGVAREVGDRVACRIVAPSSIRTSSTTTLRFLIEQVGEVDGVYASADALGLSGAGTAGMPSAISWRFVRRPSGCWRRWPICAGWGGITSGNCRRAEGTGTVDKDANAHFTSVDGCSTAWNGLRRGWRPPSTHRRSTAGLENGT